MDELKRIYRERNPDGHWFDPDTMRFFGTRLGRAFWVRGTDTIYFVTSEKPPHGPRAYSVRRMDSEGEIETVGDFCSMTYAQANRMAEREAKGEALEVAQ